MEEQDENLRENTNFFVQIAKLKINVLYILSTIKRALKKKLRRFVNNI